MGDEVRAETLKPGDRVRTLYGGILTVDHVMNTGGYVRIRYNDGVSIEYYYPGEYVQISA